MDMTTRRTFRPTGVIVVMWAMVVVLTVMAFVIGTRLPEGYQFRTSETVTIGALICAVAIFALACTLSRASGDEESLTFVNGFRKHVLRWDEIAVISMRAGAPWPTVETKDGRRLPVFAIQGSEGGSARDAVSWLVGHLR
ncbi:hypothetical protein GGQ26_02655 [Aeromicrobium sp. zg-629]|nr:hypothetical protein [Aeromicrobium senzhongii]